MKTPYAHDERGMNMIELAIVMMLVGILMIIATNALLRARMASNEAAAIANLQTINNGQFAFLAGCGRGYYATSLAILGAPVAGKGEGYVSSGLATGAQVDRTGYRYSIGPGSGDPSPQDCHGSATQTKYYASAVPLSLGSSSSGDRSFATNQIGAIWALVGGTAPAEPFGPPAIPAR